MAEKKFERVEVVFSRSNEEDMKLFAHLKTKSKLLGKSKYIKLLLQQDEENEK